MYVKQTGIPFVALFVPLSISFEVTKSKGTLKFTEVYWNSDPSDYKAVKRIISSAGITLLFKSFTKCIYAGTYT